MISDLKSLMILTVRQPAQAARIIVAQKLDQNTGWMVLGLAVLLNTLAYFLSITLFPVPEGIGGEILTSPFAMAFLLGVTILIFVIAFFWVGKSIGGQGRFEDVLLMMGWLQYLRLAVQLIALVLMLVAPGVAQMFVMAAGLYGVWVVINFINVVHQFDSLGRSVTLVVLSMLALVAGMSFFLSLIGVTAMGIS